MTNVQVPEIINGHANGIIITEQDIYLALAVLNEVYARDGVPLLHLITPWVEISSPPWEQPQRVQEISLVFDIVRKALDLGLVPSMDIVIDSDYEFARVLEEAVPILAIYYGSGEWPSSESILESVQRLFGNQ